MYLQHPNGYRVDIAELTEECKQCEGSGKVKGVGESTTDRCRTCNGLGCVLSDGVSGFITTLLEDDDVYYGVLKFAKKLMWDLKNT